MAQKITREAAQECMKKKVYQRLDNLLKQDMEEKNVSESDDDETSYDDTSDETSDETSHDETCDHEPCDQDKKQILVELFEEYQKIRTDNMVVGANDSCLNEAMTEVLYEFMGNTVGKGKDNFMCEEKNNNPDYWLGYLYTNTCKKLAKSVANQMYELSLKIETIMNGMCIKYTELEKMYYKNLYKNIK